MMRGADILQIQRLGLTAFGDDQDAGIAGAPCLLGRLAAQLPVFGLVVAPH